MATGQLPAQRGEQLPIRVKGSSKCPNHKQNEIIFVCIDCDEELICATCCVLAHKSHEFVELSSVTRQKNSMLQEFVNDTEKYALPQLKIEIQSTHNELTENGAYFCQLRTGVKQQGEKCKQEIDDLITENIKICDKMEIINQNLLKDHINQLQQQYATLDCLLNECKQTLQTGTAVLVHDLVSDVQKLDSKIPNLPTQRRPDFQPCKDKLDFLKKVVGTLSTERFHKEKVIKIKLLKEPVACSKFKFRHHISRICPTTESHAWISNIESNLIELIDTKGQTQQDVRHLDKIRDISRSPKTGHIWFCCKEAKTVCEVSASSKKPVIKFKTNDQPYSICVTKEESVVLGMENKVTIYSENGVILHSSSHDMSGIASSGEITQCPITSNIAVLSAEILKRKDSGEDAWKGNVIIYDRKLQVKTHYKGKGIQSSETPTEELFCPRSISYDRNGNLLVADMKRNTIELISGLGQYIKTLCYNTQGQGVIGLENGQVLWTTSKPSTGKWEIQLLKYYSA
ncbi:uncharacterized protein LOC110462639 [Mizuhopecten yessoensis]|uniref:uncharacterized protein LOC110462639 n=1 Tax=Mizuhopecten yessoensis TaxID=6573 RepID=UPI000B459570|nr:uncharacterized protein LOC110462639 [Mizuhopecten yessoensis]